MNTKNVNIIPVCVTDAFKEQRLRFCIFLSSINVVFIVPACVIRPSGTQSSLRGLIRLKTELWALQKSQSWNGFSLREGEISVFLYRNRMKDDFLTRVQTLIHFSWITAAQTFRCCPSEEAMTDRRRRKSNNNKRRLQRWHIHTFEINKLRLMCLPTRKRVNPDTLSELFISIIYQSWLLMGPQRLQMDPEAELIAATWTDPHKLRITPSRDHLKHSSPQEPTFNSTS